MPTQSTTYNSRVTDEALEKRFRDTFRSQGGAELVDDLYAQGVIVPIVDFTAAATGQQLAENLQTAWDFTTGHTSINGSTETLISNAGFWKVDLNVVASFANTPVEARLNITDGLTSKVIWEANFSRNTADFEVTSVQQDVFVVFLRSGDSLTGTTSGSNQRLDVVYRQIATVSGDLVDPSGFTSS